MFSSHVILDFRVEDYPSPTKETEVSPFCHNQNSNFLESDLEPVDSWMCGRACLSDTVNAG